MTSTSKTWMPTVAGILMIIAGGLGILRGIGALIGGLFAGGFWRFVGFEFGGWINIVLAVVVLIAGFAALGRKTWWLALIGAVIAAMHFFVLGIVSIILVALSKKEFN